MFIFTRFYPFELDVVQAYQLSRVLIMCKVHNYVLCFFLFHFQRKFRISTSPLSLTKKKKLIDLFLHFHSYILFYFDLP